MSPRALARIGGVLYLIIIGLGLFEELVVRGSIVVPGNAGATAANLKSMETLWRYGVAAEMVLLTCGTILGVILFALLRPIHFHLALLALALNLVTIAVEASGALFLLAALFPLGKAAYLTAFQPEQLAAMASLMTRWHTHAFSLALIFFGWECVVVGFLIHRSTYLPKLIGVLMLIAGLSYVLNSFLLILAPRFVNLLLLVPSFIGEFSLALWLVVKGVDLERWNRRQAHEPIRAAS